MDASAWGAWRPITRRFSLQCLAAWPWLTNVQAKAAQPTGVQLASDWSPGRSPQGFLVSEKFDGVRAVWDGQQLRFRSGREISAPDWFVRALPAHPLDGELWLGRGQFDRLSGVVRQQSPQEAGWRAVRYLVFDAPGGEGSFASRSEALAAVIAAARLPWLQGVEQFLVSDAAALAQRLQAVVNAGGEGLVLHRATALWHAGRSDALFKFKPEMDDEAEVVGYQPGKGRHAGLTGALVVRLPDGVKFELGSGLSDAQRRDPPALGSWVTYRYRDRTPSGLPRFATFVRTRLPE